MKAAPTALSAISLVQNVACASLVQNRKDQDVVAIVAEKNGIGKMAQQGAPQRAVSFRISLRSSVYLLKSSIEVCNEFRPEPEIALFIPACCLQDIVFGLGPKAQHYLFNFAMISPLATSQFLA